MSRFPQPVRANAVLGALLLTLVTGLAACDEDGKTAPENCVDPEPYDIQGDGVKSKNPCVNGVGHAVNAAPPSAGASSGGSATVGSGGMATVDAGAGGASGAGGAP